MGQNWLLGKSLLLQEHWEWVLPRVLCVNFFDFDLAIGEVVVENVVFVATIVRSIFPKNVEAKNFSIVVEEALQSLVRSATLEHNLDIFLYLALVRRRLLEVHHGAGMSELIIWEAL